MPEDVAEAFEPAIGSHPHDSDTALEQANERAVTAVDGDRPSGRDPHKRPIDRAARPVEGLRGAILPGAGGQDLYPLLAFRHVFRRKYGGFSFARAAPSVPHAACAVPAAAAAVEDFCRAFGIVPSAFPRRFARPA